MLIIWNEIYFVRIKLCLIQSPFAIITAKMFKDLIVSGTRYTFSAASCIFSNS